MAAVGAAGAVAVVYFLAARLGLLLLSAPSDVAVFWPAAGIAAGTLIVLGWRAGPVVAIGVVAGTVAANLMGDRSLLTSLLKGFCNAGEAVLAAWLLERWFGWPFKFADLRRVAGFLAAAGLATAISAIGGAATMSLLHTTAPYWDIWRAWFLSDGVGIVVVAPLVIGLAEVAREPPSRREWTEGVGVLGLTALVSFYAMSHKPDSWLSFSPGAIVLPLLLWLTARCPRPFGIGGAFIASAAVILATTCGMGRFGDAAVPIMERVKGAQVATTMVTIYTLVLVALFAQRKEAEGQLAKKSAALARLHEISSQLWFERDLSQALDEILAGAIELLAADTGIVRILDPTRGALTIEAHRGIKQEFVDLFYEMPAAGTSACARALRSGQRIVIADVESVTLIAPSQSLTRAAGYRAIQSTPIKGREGRPLGVLSTHFRTAHKPDEQDLRLLDLYVRQAADIIERHKGEDALRKSEERLRLAQLKTGIGIWDWDLHTGALTWTPELEAIFGLEPGRVRSYADFRDRVHPDDIDAVEVGRDAAVRRRETFNLEFRIIRSDGQVRWVLATGGAFYDKATGEPTRILGNNVDITDRKRAERAMAERNTQLELASKAALVGSFSVDFSTGIVKLSPGSATIYGLAEGTGETSRDNVRQRVYPADLPQLEAQRDQAFLAQQREFNTQCRIVRADDGQVRWLEVRSLIFYHPSGKPSHLIGANIDITERKRTEVALAERNAQLTLAGRAALVGSYAYDVKRKMLKFSEGYAAIYDLPEGTREMTGDQRRALVHPDDLERLDRVRSQAFEQRQGEFSIEYRNILPKRGVRWIESRSLVFYDSNGRPERLVGVNIDITERKRAELALTERNAQLAMVGQAALVGSYAYESGLERMTVSEGYAAIHGLPEGTTDTTRSQWRARVHADDRERLDGFRARALGDKRHDYNVEYRIIRGGEIRWIESRSTISYDADGRPRRVIGINIDITKRKQTEARLSDALAAGQVVAFEWEAATGQSERSDNADRITGVVDGRRFLSQVHPDDRDSFRTLIRGLSPGNPSYALTFRFIRPDGGQVWLEETAKGEFDSARRLVRIKGLTRDITERKELEDHKNTLISELDHRVKNVLATISAVASRTQETSSSMAEFVAALDGRIRSMATTHELLSYRHWQGIPLAEIVRRELAPYATAQNTQIAGPDVVLSAEASQTLAMVIHELATNAAKFGAISTESGRVSVRWSFRRNGRAESWLCIDWQESGGPHVVPPTRSGFGISVVRELIPYELGGTADLVHLPAGVRCKLEIPAHWLSASIPSREPSSDVGRSRTV